MMKQRPELHLLGAVVLAAMTSCPAAETIKALPDHAAEHTAGPAYLKAPRPEVNPWAAKGIPSKHVFGALYTRKHYPGAKWHEISRTGEFTDVVVRFGEGELQVLFGRVSSYHPEVLLGDKVLSSFPEIIAAKPVDA